MRVYLQTLQLLLPFIFNQNLNSPFPPHSIFYNSFPCSPLPAPWFSHLHGQHLPLPNPSTIEFLRSTSTKIKSNHPFTTSFHLLFPPSTNGLKVELRFWLWARLQLGIRIKKWFGLGLILGLS